MEYLLLLIVLIAIADLSLYKHCNNRSMVTKAIKHKKRK